MSLGYLWLDLIIRILFASNSLKPCLKLFFLIDVSSYCKEQKKKKKLIKINFYIKISKNLGCNFFKFRKQLFGYLAIFRNFNIFNIQ